MSAGCRSKAGAMATTPASPMAASSSTRDLSRGRAPRPRAPASAEAPASPTCIELITSMLTAGSEPAPSPSASRCTPSGPPAPEVSTDPRVPSVASSTAERPLWIQSAIVASRSSLQLCSPTLRHSAAAASYSAFSCCRSACVTAHSPRLALLKSMAKRGSSGLRSPSKTTHSTSSPSVQSVVGPSWVPLLVSAGVCSSRSRDEVRRHCRRTRRRSVVTAAVRVAAMVAATGMEAENISRSRTRSTVCFHQNGAPSAGGFLRGPLSRHD
eukprot:scaffold121712_cov63-Phaeocystis_antarctica.AAC.2